MDPDEIVPIVDEEEALPAAPAPASASAVAREYQHPRCPHGYGPGECIDPACGYAP